MRTREEIMLELAQELVDASKTRDFKSAKQRTMARVYQASILEVLLDIRDLLEDIAVATSHLK